MIYAALNKLIAAFGDPVKVGWLVTAYMLVGAGAAAVAGRLGDLFGRKLVIQILLAMGLIGALMSASTDHSPSCSWGASSRVSPAHCSRSASGWCVKI